MVPEEPTMWVKKKYDIRRGQERDGPDYKPTALRWPFLSTLLGALLITLALLSYAVNVLPSMIDHTEQPPENVKAKRHQAATRFTAGNMNGTITIVQIARTSLRLHRLASNAFEMTTATVYKAQRAASAIEEGVWLTKPYTRPHSPPTRGSPTKTTLLPFVLNHNSTVVDSSLTYTPSATNYGRVGYETVTVTVTLTAYGHSDHQTVTELVTETIGEASEETPKPTIQETVFTDLPEPEPTFILPDGSHTATFVTVDSTAYGHGGQQTVTVTFTETIDEAAEETLNPTTIETIFTHLPQPQSTSIPPESPVTLDHTAYSHSSHQTATELVTETIGEAAEETPNPTSTKNVFIYLPQPESTFIDAADVITVTKSPFSAPVSVPREHGDVSDRTSVETPHSTAPALAFSRPVADSGEEMLSAIQVASATVVTDYGSITTQAVTDDPLHYTRTQAMDTDTIIGPHVEEIVVFLVDAQGSAIAMSTIQALVSGTGEGGVSDSLRDMTRTRGLTTRHDAQGSPVATWTMSSSLLMSVVRTILTDTAGRPVATQVRTVLITSSVSVKTTGRANPTATISTDPTNPETHTIVYYISPGEYFMGMFLPTIVASFLAVFVRILTTNVKVFQPWHALTHDRGAFGRDSISLPTHGWQSIVKSFTSLPRGKAVIFLSYLLQLFSAILVPLSAEAVALDLRGEGCKRGASSAENCAWVLSTSTSTSKAAIALLIVMSMTMIALYFQLGRWRLGVYANPRSICALALLSLNDRARQLAIEGMNDSTLKDLKFKLGHFEHRSGKMEYGIIDLGCAGCSDQRAGRIEAAPPDQRLPKKMASNRRPSLPFFILRYPGKISLLFTVCGVLVLILYYSQTGGDTAFERFLDSDSFGVRFLFTSFGSIISFFWSSFFNSK
jgi:hypothetical protein